MIMNYEVNQGPPGIGPARGVPVPSRPSRFLADRVDVVDAVKTPMCANAGADGPADLLGGRVNLESISLSTTWAPRLSARISPRSSRGRGRRSRSLTTTRWSWRRTLNTKVGTIGLRMTCHRFPSQWSRKPPPRVHGPCIRR